MLRETSFYAILPAVTSYILEMMKTCTCLSIFILKRFFVRIVFPGNAENHVENLSYRTFGNICTVMSVFMTKWTPSSFFQTLNVVVLAHIWLD